MTQPASILEQQIEQLGEARAMIIDCLGGNGRFTPVRFAPTSPSSYVEAYRAYIAGLSTLEPRDGPDITRLLLAAGRLLLGELAEADGIVDSFPPEPYRLDHGAGYCNVAHLTALRAALPWPDELGDVARWVAGSAVQGALRDWLEVHRGALRWVEERGVYVRDG